MGIRWGGEVPRIILAMINGLRRSWDAFSAVGRHLGLIHLAGRSPSGVECARWRARASYSTGK